MRFVLLIFLAFLSACTSSRQSNQWAWDKPSPKLAKGKPHFKVGRPYTVKGRRYYPKETYSYSETGIASWYGPGFHGRLTANGEVFDMHKVSAAHKTLQLPCLVRVTNLQNGRVLLVRVNDRGPYHRNRVIDLSRGAAHKLGILQKGTARVRVEVVSEHSKKLTKLARRGYFPQRVSGLNVVTERPVVRLARKPSHIRLASPVQRFALQIKGIDSPEKALDYHSELSCMGQVGIKEYAVNGKQKFALHIGPYKNKEDALTLVAKLENMGHAGIQITDF